MNTAKILFVILSGFLFFVTAAHTEQIRSGTERGMTTPPKTAPNTNIMPAPLAPVPQAILGAKEPRPLKDILIFKIEKIVPPLCDSLPQAVDKIVKMVDELGDAIKTALNQHVYAKGELKSFYAAGTYYASGIKTHCCSQQKSFSVQEQQAAGCAESDTVKLCMDKLIKHCIIKTGQTFQVKSDIQKAEEKANNLSIKSKQLSDQMKYLLSIMP